MFINVNVCDLCLNVIYMSPLKGMLMREDDKEAGREKTDGHTQTGTL